MDRWKAGDTVFRWKAAGDQVGRVYMIFSKGLECDQPFLIVIAIPWIEEGAHAKAGNENIHLSAIVIIASIERAHGARIVVMGWFFKYEGRRSG